VAHQIYLERMESGEPGNSPADWLEAERRTGLHAPPQSVVKVGRPSYQPTRAQHEMVAELCLLGSTARRSPPSSASLR
jgi:hypothetical protein